MGFQEYIMWISSEIFPEPLHNFSRLFFRNSSGYLLRKCSKSSSCELVTNFLRNSYMNFSRNPPEYSFGEAYADFLPKNKNSFGRIPPKFIPDFPGTSQKVSPKLASEISQDFGSKNVFFYTLGHCVMYSFRN